MKKKSGFGIGCALLSCGLLLSSCTPLRYVKSAVTVEVAPVTETRDEILLTELPYGKYAMNGTDIPLYCWDETQCEYFEVKGVRYLNGVTISPVSDYSYEYDPGHPIDEPMFDIGYIEYDISEISQKYDIFVCKVGKLDSYLGAGEPVLVSFYIDNKKMSYTPKIEHGSDAFLIDVTIPYGAKTMRIECRSTGKAALCTTVIGDGRFTHSQLMDSIPWPE